MGNRPSTRQVVPRALASLLLLLTNVVMAPVGVAASTAACEPLTGFSPSHFSHSTAIDSRWSPLAPGMQYTLEGRADRGGGVLPHRVVLTVTDLTKVIDGVTTRVIFDRDFNEDQLVEAELAFFAQDDHANVWVLGEYPEEYEDGEFLGAPSTWISGQAGADGGVLVPGTARLGSSWFLQGRAPEIDFLDCGKVSKTGQSVCVPVGCYDGVLVVDEKSPLDPGSGTQRKYYAPGVGNVQIDAVGDKEGETLVLVDIRRLTGASLTAARRNALQLERRAYTISDVYAQTPPASR
jgi:hypothetical protein